MSLTNGLAQNLFRSEVDDDVVFDLDTTFQEGVQGEKSNKEATTSPPYGGQGFQMPNFLGGLKGIKGPDIQGPDIQGPDIGLNIKSPKIQPLNIGIPNIDLSFPDIPKIDLNAQSPDFQSAIDAVSGALGASAEAISDVAEATSEVIKPVVEPVVESGGEILQFIGKGASSGAEVLGEAVRPVSEVLAGVGESTANLINETIGNVGNALGYTAEEFSDLSVRQGDGSKYGEISIGDTGAVIDISERIDSTFNELTRGTELEGVSGRDMYDIAVNPEGFVKNKGLEEGAKFLELNLGVESGLAGDIVSAIDNPEEFAKKKGTEKVTEFVMDATGFGAKEALKETTSKAGSAAGGAAAQGLAGQALGAAGGAAIGGGVAGGVGALLSGADAAQVAEAAAKGAATSAVVKGVSTLANALLPGSGFVIEAAAVLFKYSCYLSTSAYYNGFVDKKLYFQFTHYRIKIQSKEPFSEAVWLGYINFFEKRYNKLIHDKVYAERMYKWVTAPWLSHIQYLLGKGSFTLKGWVVTQLLKCVCLGAYAFNYKSSKKRKKELQGINIINIYKFLVRIIEGRAYA